MESVIRPVKIVHDAFGYADASVLFEQGKTKILCNVTLQDGVPPFLKHQGTGWLTAEYSMLPCATHYRTTRESSQQYRNPRSVEISRLIGRSLRTTIDLKMLGEKTIYVDCDVLQADGGTRVASITAASCALQLAQTRWLKKGSIKQPIISEPVAAISVGIVDGEVQLDLNQQQDSQAQADFNFVVTKSGAVVEIQGTAEKMPVSWEQFELLRKAALVGTEQLFVRCTEFFNWLENKKTVHTPSHSVDASDKHVRHDIVSPSTVQAAKSEKAPFFSLANRQLSKDVSEK